jgi:lysophospholipid acyltransferase (LPLAT)-like uncharacterized protein
MNSISGRLLVWATKLVKAGFIDLRLSGEEHVHASIRQGRPVIFAGWHGHNFLTMCSYYAYLQQHFKGATIMVPESSNGLIMNYLASRIGFKVIKVKPELGPSQWARATVSMIKHIRGGCCALLSPDGPTGPAYEVKPGIAVIGQQTQAVVIPASAAARRGFKLQRRWDEHLIPLPFTKAVVHFGTPIDTNSANADDPAPSVEELQARIGAALTEGAAAAEAWCRGSSANRKVDAR